MSSVTDNPMPASTASPAAPPEGLRLRLVRPDDGPALHGLLLASLPDVPQPPDRWLKRWNWQAWDNPFRADRPAGWVLETEGRLVGHLGAVYLPLHVEGRQQAGMIAADYAVAPEALVHGGAFAGLTLAQAFFDATNGALPLATTANEKTGAVFHRYGCRPVPWTREFWRAPTTIAQQVRTCRGANHRVLRRLLSGAGLRLAGWLYAQLCHRPHIRIPAGCRLETTTPRLALDLGNLHDRLHADRASTSTRQDPHDALIGVDRSQPYLDWRYGHHPEHDHHRVITIRDADGHALAGVIIFLNSAASPRDQAGRSQIGNIERADTGAPSPRALVEDLIAPPYRPDLVKTLLCASLLLAADHGAEFLVTTPGRADLRPLFWELGFEPRARNAPAVVMPGEHSPDAALDFWCGAMF